MKTQIERIAHKANSFQEAEDWDIEQQLHMTPEERQEAARPLRARVYGENQPDMRESHRPTNDLSAVFTDVQEFV